MKLSINQKGFTVIEGLLVFVIVAIIGGTGYYVYHSNKQADKNLKNASSSAEFAKKKKETKKTTKTPKTEIFLIPEWKVSAEIPVPPEEAALIQYKIIASANPAVAGFTTQELVDIDKSSCSADNSVAGSIVRARGADRFPTEGDFGSGKTVQQAMTTGVVKTYKKLGDYYYWYVHPQSLCGTDDRAVVPQKSAITQVEAIVANLTQQ